MDEISFLFLASFLSRPNFSALVVSFFKDYTAFVRMRMGGWKEGGSRVYARVAVHVCIGKVGKGIESTFDLLPGKSHIGLLIVSSKKGYGFYCGLPLACVTRYLNF